MGAELRGDPELATAGLGSLVAGGAPLSIGTPLVVMGLQSVPVEPSSLRPALRIVGRGAALRWSF